MKCHEKTPNRNFINFGESPLKNGDNTEGCLPEGWEDYLFVVLKKSEFLDFWPIVPDIINVNEMDS